MNDDPAPRALSSEELDSKVERTVASIDALLREPVTHATYEELAGLVDGTLGEVEEEIVRMHLEDCAMCAGELDDLRRLAAPAAIARRRPWMRNAWLLAASLLMAVAIGSWFIAREQQAPKGRHAPATFRNVVVLHDATGEIALDERGQVHGIALPLASTAAALLRNPSLAPPAVLASVRSASSTLRGSEEQALAVIEPVGRIVLEDRPQFSWKGARGNASVAVYDESSLRRVAASGTVRGGRWTPDAPLPRGVTLTWQVSADGMLAPPPSVPPARFRIVDAQAFTRIGEARRSGSHLLLGAALAEAGLRDDAEAELRQLAEMNPQSAAARSLLTSVKSWPR